MMAPREKTIAIVVGALVAVGILYLAVDRIVLAPLRELDDQSGKFLSDIDRLGRSQSAKVAQDRRMKTLAAATLGTDADQVSSLVQSRLADLLAKNGLGNAPLDAIKPFDLPKLSDKQLGWKIRVKGRLDQIVNFLYCLDGEPYLHRIDSLKLTPRNGAVELEASYLTLVLAAPRLGKPPATMSAGAPGGALDDRPAGYDIIVSRDLFRPYIPRPPRIEPPALAKTDRPSTAPAPEPQGNSDFKFQITDLSTYAGQAEVGVRNVLTNESSRYRTGDNLAGGRIVMIDYRKLPFPDQPDLLSQSRVILSIGGEYFAVERGRTLAQKYHLPPTKLPPQLLASGQPASAPATIDPIRAKESSAALPNAGEP